MDYKSNYRKYKVQYKKLKESQQDNSTNDNYESHQVKMGVADTFPNKQPNAQSLDPVIESEQSNITPISQPPQPPSENLEDVVLPPGVDLHENLKSPIQSITQLGGDDDYYKKKYFKYKAKYLSRKN